MVEDPNWTGLRPIPSPGDRVFISLRTVGQGVVVQPVTHLGRTALVVKPEHPPRWYINEFGRDTTCLCSARDLADFGSDYGYVVPDDLTMAALIRECEDAIPHRASFVDRNAMFQFMWLQATWTQGLTPDLVTLVISMTRLEELMH